MLKHLSQLIVWTMGLNEDNLDEWVRAMAQFKAEPETPRAELYWAQAQLLEIMKENNSFSYWAALGPILKPLTERRGEKPEFSPDEEDVRILKEVFKNILETAK